MTTARKYYYRCSECNSKTSTTNEDRAVAKVCVNCRPDLDAAPAKVKKAKAAPIPRAKTEPVAPAPSIERVAGSLADARRAIGPNADFEGFRAEGVAVMYLYEEPAEAPARAYSMAMAKRRLTEPQFQLKFGSLSRKGQMVGTRVVEIPLDPAAPENVAADADVVDAANTTDADAPAPTAEVAPATVDNAPSATKAAPTIVVPSKRRKPSALDAAALVLREAGIPMTAKEIFGAILERNLWTSPKGRTPAATIAAALLRETVNKGPASRFLKAERGKFVANPAVA